MTIIEIDLAQDFILLPRDQLLRISEIVNASLCENKKSVGNGKLDFNALKDYYNLVFAKSMRVVTDKTKANLNKRIKEGYLKSDIQKVIDNASNDKYHEPNDFKHVTLEFLSRADIFARYVSEREHQVPRHKKLLKQRLEQGHTNH